jgi:hypothetical protein
VNDARLRRLEERFPEPSRCDHGGPDRVEVHWPEDGDEPDTRPTHCPDCGKQLVFRLEFDRRG